MNEIDDKIKIMRPVSGLSKLKMKHIEILAIDLELLLSLVPRWAREVPKGLDPTFYGTNSYLGDLCIKARIDSLQCKINQQSYGTSPE